MEQRDCKGGGGGADVSSEDEQSSEGRYCSLAGWTPCSSAFFLSSISQTMNTRKRIKRLREQISERRRTEVVKWTNADRQKSFASLSDGKHRAQSLIRRDNRCINSFIEITFHKVKLLIGGKIQFHCVWQLDEFKRIFANYL